MARIARTLAALGLGALPPSATKYAESIPGVGTRTVTDPNGTTGTWTYNPVLTPGEQQGPAHPQPNELVNTVTDPFGETAVFRHEASPSSTRRRVTRIEGGCDLCGVGRARQLVYDDPRHPVRATEAIDGRGHVTRFAYDDLGRLVARTEAAGTADARTTRWRYDDDRFPDRATQIDAPSVKDRLRLPARTVIVPPSTLPRSPIARVGRKPVTL